MRRPHCNEFESRNRSSEANHALQENRRLLRGRRHIQDKYINLTRLGLRMVEGGAGRFLEKIGILKMRMEYGKRFGMISRRMNMRQRPVNERVEHRDRGDAGRQLS